MKLNSKEKEELIRIFDENGYNVTNIDKLSTELESWNATYLGTKEDIIDQWADLMNINFPLDFLDQDYIIRNDDDWEELSEIRYVNKYRLFEDEEYIKKLEYDMKYIEQQ